MVLRGSKLKIHEGKKIPIYSWCNELEESAMKQAIDLSYLPFAYKRLCLMPDCHTGYGMPIGGVIALRGAVIPNCVGVDIGCGMIAVKTSLREISIGTLKAIMSLIRLNVPVGFNHHKEDRIWEGFELAPDIGIIKQELNSAKKQLGTLGGGNHFIEIQKGDDGHIWIMIHSGSRNFGLKIAHHYNKIATELCTQWYSDIPPIKGQDGLAFLPLNTPEAKEYLECMNFALSFALANRRLMMEECKKAFLDVCDCTFEDPINIHHNYAAMEYHECQNLMVHRKGATSARKGELGIIPGSQGTNSYIVEGLGNPSSFQSCSHGAGRKISRKYARENLSLENEKKILEDQGIIHSIRQQKDLDEASSAYKNIQDVMEAQKDLVNIKVKLTPLAVIKG